MIMLMVWGFILTLLACFLVVGVIIAWALLAPRRYCPGCNQPLPRVRKPVSREEALRGGWTCEHCGTVCDRHGRRLEDGPAPAAAAPAAIGAPPRYEQLSQLKELLDSGALSQEEFEREKQRLLGHDPIANPSGTPSTGDAP